MRYYTLVLLPLWLRAWITAAAAAPQDLDQEELSYARACPDYKAYSTFMQLVLLLELKNKD
jgi:hypothetical protein